MARIARQQILAFVDTIPGALIDQPFKMDFETTILRHRDSRKWFGALLRAPCRQVNIDRDGVCEVLNLKCEALLGYALIQAHRGITPGYHMNKRHWISVVLDSDVPWELLRTLILDSYRITGKKK